LWCSLACRLRAAAAATACMVRSVARCCVDIERLCVMRRLFRIPLCLARHDGSGCGAIWPVDSVRQQRPQARVVRSVARCCVDIELSCDMRRLISMPLCLASYGGSGCGAVWPVDSVRQQRPPARMVRSVARCCIDIELLCVVRRLFRIPLCLARHDGLGCGAVWRPLARVVR
jgi:hypothetical protein